MPEWLILVYKVSSEPSRLRAAVWRKLKAAGAIYLQDGVATLPAEAPAERALRGLAAEVREMGGTAHLLQAVPLGGEEALVALFNAAREAEYRELLNRCRDFHAELEGERVARNFTFAELEENEDDLAKLEAWRGKIRARDHFATSLGIEAEAALRACHEDLEAFAKAVYVTVDHGAARDIGDETDSQGETDSRRAGNRHADNPGDGVRHSRDTRHTSDAGAAAEEEEEAGSARETGRGRGGQPTGKGEKE